MRVSAEIFLGELTSFEDSKSDLYLSMTARPGTMEESTELVLKREQIENKINPEFMYLVLSQGWSLNSDLFDEKFSWSLND